MLPQDTMTSRKGFFVLTNGTKTGNFAGFVPKSPVVVTHIKINEAAADSDLATWGLAGEEFPAGFPVLFADNERVTSITVTGSAYLIRR